METRVQPKPEIVIKESKRGIVSKKNYFFNKILLEQINRYFFSGLLIRSWKPKAELIYSSTSDENIIQYECDFNREIQNCFVEDLAEEVYLRNPPPCFVVLGKSGNNVRKLCREIAEEYGSVLLEVDEIVGQVINTESQTAEFLKKILRLGVSLTLNFVLALLSYLAHSAEARHRGYVISGLPCVPFRFDLSVEQQLNYLFSWENKPNIFVYVSFEDEDLIVLRSCERYEIDNSLVESCQMIPRFKCNENIEEYNDENNDDDKLCFSKKEENFDFDQAVLEPDIDVPPSSPWIMLPKDEESHIWAELQTFYEVIQPALQLLKVRVDPQYFITVDSRIQNNFEIVKARLSLLQIWKVPVPLPIFPPSETDITEKDNEEIKSAEGDNLSQNNELDEEFNNNDDNLEVQNIIKEPPKLAFLTLLSKETLSPKFQWELSHYNYVCPVALRNGEIIEGKTEFAVRFMKYIYFIRDKESMLKFLKNPRPFVLPVRPKPPIRIFIMGYPYCDKTKLAQAISNEFCVPLIDLNSVLRSDLEAKKNIYIKHCKEKAIAREFFRLTALAWKNWRTEEEQRVSLIEECIEFIQSLLNQRIEEFYSLDKKKDEVEKDFSKNQMSDILGSEEGEGEEEEDRSKNSKKDSITNLEVRGVPITTASRASDARNLVTPENHSSPSVKIIQALRHEDYDFSKNGLEFEANVFFSTLWNSFTERIKTLNETEFKKYQSEKGEDTELDDGSVEFSYEEESSQSNISVNWCSLLPPQSLSSLLLKKKPYSSRERIKTFRILLEAASKVYWEPSTLKTEFAKWRLPCYMDIPLCELLTDNPVLLYRYCPDWVKERPMIPDPISSSHPALIQAGQEAVSRAKIVSLHHYKDEIGTLLKNEIEKLEKDNMRITGEILSPGGWVVDNMSLDFEVWCILARENIFPTHVYVLTDSEPDYRRIITIWYHKFFEYFDTQSSANSEILLDTPRKHVSTHKNVVDYSSAGEADESETTKSDGAVSPKEDIVQMLIESCRIVTEEEKVLDDIFNILIADSDVYKEKSMQPFIVDPFSYNILHDKIKRLFDTSEELALEESTILTTNFSVRESRLLFLNRQIDPSMQEFPLGAKLQIFTNKVLNVLSKYPSDEFNSEDDEQSYKKGIEFFFLLLTLTERLKELKEWLNKFKREIKWIEIDVNGKKAGEIFSNVINELYLPFGKKPRELLPYEIQEIEKAFEIEKKIKRKIDKHDENYEVINSKDENETVENENELENFEDVRIFGESGPFCIVNLERNILLKGNIEHVLRYYGKLYFFWNSDAKDKFIENPEKYAPYYSPIRSLPPLRVYVIGPFGGNKPFVGSSISKQCSLHYIDYIRFLNKQLIPHISPSPHKIRALDKSLLLSNSHNANAKKAFLEFKGASFKKRQFWLENPPFYSENWENEEQIRELLNLEETPVNLGNVNLNYKTLNSCSEDTIDFFKSSKVDFEEYLNMDRIANLIWNYIHGDAKLADYCVRKSLAILWKNEPYIREGFVMKDFPMRSTDCQIILNNNWLPDFMIEVNITEEVAIQNSIDKLMGAWEIKLNKEAANEQLIEDAIKTIQETRINLKRIHLLNAKHSENKSGENLRKTFSQKSTIPEKSQKKIQDTEFLRENRKTSLKMSFQTSQTNEKSSILSDKLNSEIEQQLKKEFPPLMFSPKFETYDEGKARVEEDIKYNYQKDVLEMEKIKSQLKNLGIPWLTISDCYDLSKVFIELDKFKKRKNQRGEFAFTVSMEMAEKLLKQGFYFLSKFGRLCPVQAYRKKNPVNMFRPFSLRKKIFPIVYRTYIYFVAGENEKIKFIEDPIRYTFHEPHHPCVPLRLAVIGPPKSGKSALCKRLGSMFGLKVLTMGSAIRFVLNNMKNSELRKTINNHLKRGCFLPLSLKIEALAACLNDPSCVTQGFVFDGIPFDAATAQSLAEKKILPFVILSLVCESSFGKKKRSMLNLKEFRLPYKQRVNLDSRYMEWNETYQRFCQWNKKTYNNLYEINAKSSLCDIFYEAYDIIKNPYFGILHYVEFSATENALPLRYLCVTKQEFECRRSDFLGNCPVCWGKFHRLKSTTNDKMYTGLVQFGNYFYWVCSNHFDEFLKHPKKFLPPNVRPWPLHFPIRLDPEEKEIIRNKYGIHGHGRCAVTRIDFPGSLDWEGSWDHVAVYMNEIFLFKDENMLERFMTLPWRYGQADTIFEGSTLKSQAVEKLGPPKVTSLPPMGFLEQTISKLIHKALHVLGSVRPIYPKLNPSCTGCIFLALFLKVNNENKKVVSLEKEYLDFMYYYCKAYRFKIPFYVKRDPDGLMENDLDMSVVNESRATLSENKSSQGTLYSGISEVSFDEVRWRDVENQADKKIWSAKYQSNKYEEMILTENNELNPISEIPKRQVVLRYHHVKHYPLPPILFCFTVLYSVKPDIQLPEPFNVNSLYQEPLTFGSPYNKAFINNPERQFSIELYVNSEIKKDESEINLKSQAEDSTERTVKSDSEQNIIPVQTKEDMLRAAEEIFIPRFSMFDVVLPKRDIEKVKVVEFSPIIYEPQRDYTYTMMLSHFLRTSHVLKCFEWNEVKACIEFTSLYQKNIGLSVAQSQFMFKPKVKTSEKSLNSIKSYQRIFENANVFKCRDTFSSKGSSDQDSNISADTSLYNFLQLIILEKIDELFIKISKTELSYDSYETEIVSFGSENEIKPQKIMLIREVLPYPPLIWDIYSRPYYSYNSIPTIFKIPALDNIAHVRHVSLLDGIVEPCENFRFVRYPTWVDQRPETSVEAFRGDPKLIHLVDGNLRNFYLIYDFFNLKWTSFLPYPLNLKNTKEWGKRFSDADDANNS